jgi:hypothetical protein
MVERHVYQTSAGGATLCPFETKARILGGTATPLLARSLAHKYGNHNARAVADAASEPIVEQRAHAPQSPRKNVHTLVL